MKASKRQLENRISILVPLNVLEKLSLSSQLNFNVVHNLIWYFFRKQFPEARETCWNVAKNDKQTESAQS